MKESRGKRRPRRTTDKKQDSIASPERGAGAPGSAPTAAARGGSRFAWVAPVLLLAVVATGIWYFVFRDDRAGQVDALVVQAREAMSTFEHGRAEVLLKQAIDLSPGSGLLHHNLAVTYLRQGRLVDARREFETAVSLYGPEANEVRAEENWQLAQLDVQESRWKDGERHLLRAIADHPTRALLHHRLIDLQLVRLKNLPAADSSTVRFLQFCGATPENMRDAAQIHSTRHSYSTAIALARQAVELSDTMVTAHVILSRSLWRAGHLEEALESLDSSLQRYPTSVDLWVLKAGVLVGLKRTEEGLETVDKALQLDPQNYQANVTLMMARYASGDYKGALAQAKNCQVMTEDENELRFLSGQETRFQNALEGKAPTDSLDVLGVQSSSGDHP